MNNVIITKTPDWLVKLAEEFNDDNSFNADESMELPPDAQVDDFFQPPDQGVEIQAEVNLDDLDKVMWNDEMFRVQFDDEKKIAIVYNQYGNKVATLNAATIEEVDELLNADRVVVTVKDYR